MLSNEFHHGILIPVISSTSMIGTGQEVRVLLKVVREEG